MKPTQVWRTTVTNEREYRRLSERQQGLFQRLYLSPSIDSAGFIALELDWWSSCCTPPIPMVELRDLLDSLAPAWVVTDYEAHQTLVVPRMRLDEVEKAPFVYIGACHSIVASRSDLLAEHAYSELKRLHPRSDKEAVQSRIDKAYDELLVAMEKRRERHLDEAIAETLSTPSEVGPETLSSPEGGSRASGEPFDTLLRPTGEGEGAGEGEGRRGRPVSDRSRPDPSKCSACGKRPRGGGRYFTDLCAECLRLRRSESA